MSTTARHACEITLRGNISIEEIARRERMENHLREMGAEAAALDFLRQFGPMPHWQLTRLVMDRGHNAAAADRAVKLMIISNRIRYDGATRLCSSIEPQRPGWLSRICRAISSRLL